MGVISLNKKQSSDLSTLLSSIGIDEVPTSLIKPTDDITEAEKKEKPPPAFSDKDQSKWYTGKTAKTGEVEVIIPTWLETRVKEIEPAYNYAKMWYTELSDMMVTVLGDEDAIFALSLTATTSPQQPFDRNLLLAVNAYYAYTEDVKSNPQRFWSFADIASDSLSKWSRKEDKIKDREGDSDWDSDQKRAALRAYMERRLGEYSDLKIYKVFLSNSLEALWSNTFKMLRYLDKNRGSLSRKTVVDAIKSQLAVNKGTKKNPGGSIGGNLDHTKGLIKSHKVWSFIQNLLDPTNEFTSQYYGKVSGKFDYGTFYPVTIDTWMIRFMYNKYGENIDSLKSLIFSNSGSRYIGMVKAINNLSSKFNMRPHELQAVCWLASLAEGEGTIEGKTPESAMLKNIESIKDEGDFYKKVVTGLTAMYDYIKKSKEKYTK